MRRGLRAILILMTTQVVSATFGIDASASPEGITGAADMSRWVAEEIARRRAAIRDFHALQQKRIADEKRTERLAAERSRERQREEEAMERARREYVRMRPPEQSAAEIARREREALAEIQKDEQRHERLRREFVARQDRVRRMLSAGPQINEMLEYDLTTERIDRATRGTK